MSNLKDHIKKIVKDKTPFLIKENYSSNNLFNEFSLLEISTLNQLTSGMKWIHDNDIDGVLIGGTAVVSYLSKGRTLTPDVDYLVPIMSNLKLKLKKDHIPYKDLRDYDGTDLGYTVPSFNIDFLDASKGKNKGISNLILKTSLTTTIGGVKIRIINPELLTIMKLNLGRNKDTEDAFSLINANVLNKTKYIQFVDLLKPFLKDEYQSIRSYSEMIK